MKDKELLERFNLTEQYVDAVAESVEDENMSDDIQGALIWSPQRLSNDELTTISVRMPTSLAQKLSRDATKYGLTRSEYIRRKLAHSA
ncbi:MAG: hypothetical protein Q4A71_01970 [Actinomycetaceae bacterium]|nr:hypothetical protein [Actinomycetaceae bacterium]